MKAGGRSLRRDLCRGEPNALMARRRFISIWFPPLGRTPSLGLGQEDAMENDSGSKAAIAEILRKCGLAAGRPDDREYAAELILKTGHVLTQEEADKLLAQANRVATKSPTGLLWRWITLGEWRNILLDIKAAEEHLSRLGLERPKQVVKQERKVTSAPSHYSNTWVPPEETKEDRDIYAITCAAVYDRKTAEFLASVYGKTVSEIRKIVDTHGRKVHGDLLVDRWIGKKKRRVSK